MRWVWVIALVVGGCDGEGAVPSGGGEGEGEGRLAQEGEGEPEVVQDGGGEGERGGEGEGGSEGEGEAREGEKEGEGLGEGEGEPVPSDGSGSSARGEWLYGIYCEVCHGEEGVGYLADAAPNIANRTFLESASNQFLAEAIRRGRPGTTMSAWGDERHGPLDDVDVGDVVAYMRSWGEPAVELLGAEQLPAVPEGGDAEAGGVAYAERCAACHGGAGGGVLDGGTALSLNNPWFLATASDGFLAHAIVEGRPGTAMAAQPGAEAGTQGLADLVALLRSWAVAPQEVEVARYEPDLDDHLINPGGEPAQFVLTEDRFVSAAQVNEAMAAGRKVVVLDARAASDYLRGHIAGAVSVPFYRVQEATEHLPRQDVWIVAYCGCPHALSGRVVDTLRAAGFDLTAVLDEGWYPWQNEGYPTREGPRR